ncbi:MAG: metallophosphoesterase family protein [Anaerolineae bacterium]|nr:metallophosphoesterase family protein [Anaerolineae bacterium]
MRRIVVCLAFRSPMNEPWNDEPPVNPKNWLHHALIGLHRLERVPDLVFVLIILVLGTLIGELWYLATPSILAWVAALAHLAFAAFDWLWLALLPRRKLSFGPVKPSLAGLIGVRTAIGLVALAGLWLGASALPMLIVVPLLHLLASATVVYATRIEPFRLDVTHLELHTPKMPPGASVRLVQVSDLHVERVTRREEALVRKVNALNADYILLTGDYLNFSYIGEPKAIAECRRVLGQLKAKGGIYAVRGTHQVDPNAVLETLFDGLPICWLRSERVDVGQDDCRIVLAGASASREPHIDIPAVERALSGAPPERFTVLLFHTPERVAEAVAGHVDLYLAGHTHGGQLRLPLYGALTTGSDTGKQYEMGRYNIDGMTLYVSRGIGMEGMAAPRARFLCPPEIVCIDVCGVRR